MRVLISVLLTLAVSYCGRAQSLELMPGHDFFFTDVQFLKNFDPAYRFTVFSRTRAQIAYADDAVDFFSGAYFNYTRPSGFGLSLIGRFNNAGSDVDFGPHFYKQTESITFFGIASLSLTDGGVYSWFSIFRYRPALSDKVKLYTSLELFTAMKRAAHLASTQRIRIGLDINTIQFGGAVNLTEFGDEFRFMNNNYGVFIRKEF